MTGIAAGAQYIAKSIGHDDPQQQNIKFVMDEINRLNRIISDLFNITHPHQPLLQSQQIGPVLQRSFKTVEEEAKARDVEIELELPQGLPPVEIDPDQIEQVFINLFKNGIDAAGQNGSVRVRICAGRAKLRAEESGEEPCLEVAVRDSGAGIKDEDESRIFEPFFSTKDGGTGLGLYISRGIVERHGGTISVDTGRGGSTFTVRLPLSSQNKEGSGR